jgi:hypothetical protein
LRGLTPCLRFAGWRARPSVDSVLMTSWCIFDLPMSCQRFAGWRESERRWCMDDLMLQLWSVGCAMWFYDYDSPGAVIRVVRMCFFRYACYLSSKFVLDYVWESICFTIRNQSCAVRACSFRKSMSLLPFAFVNQRTMILIDRHR